MAAVGLRVVGLSLVAALFLMACGRTGDPNPAGVKVTHAAAGSSDAARILLFNGGGVSRNDVAAIETILQCIGLAYSTADSAQLNDISETEIREYRLLIVPGGNFVEMGERLDVRTMAKVRAAVTNGVNYLGICAGAFLAGDSGYNSFDLTAGVRFRFYALEDQGIRKAAVPVAIPGWPTLEHYWEDGPQLSGWGSVVGKYPDGAPAIVQGAVGKGCVILTGVHPEAPESWRRDMTFTTPTEASVALAETLIQAALQRKELPHF